jgi:DnaD/phage-associated family protein
VAIKTKKVIIKEELVELTGDYKLAIVLNQMIYWSERVSDFDSFIQEEKERMESQSEDASSLVSQNGWIYKKADELAFECMITNSEATMRRYLDKLVQNNWLATRRNPKYKWDKTLQYRVNLQKIQVDLFKLGYFLEGYKFELPIPNFQNDDSNFQNENTNFQNDDSNFHDERAIPEITSESTLELKDLVVVEEAPVVKSESPFSFYEQNGFGVIGSHISQVITEWCSDLSDELVVEAMKIAIESSSKTWKYVEAILRNWVDKGYSTVEEVRAAQMAYKEQRSKQYKPKHKGTSQIPKSHQTPEEKPTAETIIQSGLSTGKSVEVMICLVQKQYPAIVSDDIRKLINKQIERNKLLEQKSKERANRFDQLAERLKQRINQ